MDTPDQPLQPDGQPQMWYSYDEAALLCRRSRSTIKSMVCRLGLPRIRQRHTHRIHRIALIPASAVLTLQHLTVLRGY